MTKCCPKCKKELPRGYFQKNASNRDGLSTWCRLCNSESALARRRKIYAENHEEFKANARAKANRRYQENPEFFRQKARDERARYKEIVFNHYGRVCVCCGEIRELFLTIDHIKGDGNFHRKQIASNGGAALYAWLVRNRLPEGFQTLCRNCNTAKGQLPKCPCGGCIDDTRFIGACG
jgi:hypothetical protein